MAAWIMDHYLESRREMYRISHANGSMDLPYKPSAAEFEDGKRAIASEMVTGGFLREIGEALNKGYEKIHWSRGVKASASGFHTR